MRVHEREQRNHPLLDDWALMSFKRGLASGSLFLALMGCGGENDTPAEVAGSCGGEGGGAQDAAPEARPEPPVQPETSLLIVTTEQIVSDSRVLGEYVQAKQARGMHVETATESDYGGAETQGRDRALAIRAWLQHRYREFGHLLLIGDPGTEYGDVPMLKVRPRDDMDNACSGFDCETSGTDAFYADPNGNWDLDGNGVYGEYGVDDGPGGVDFRPEMAVGRIPVYFGDTTELDRTLEHILDYMNADPSEIEYRRSILMAKSFVFFKGEIFMPNTPRMSESVDSAEASEWFIDNYLPSQRGVRVTRLYEQEGVVQTAYPSDGALTQDSFLDEWKKGYGMVWWGGHGSPRSVVRTIWPKDENQDGLPDNELASPTLIDSASTSRLEGAPGGFVVATSCLVGRVEVPDALSYKLLRHGGAVGVVSSSAPATADEASFRTMGSELDPSRFDVDRLAVLLFDQLLQGRPAGRIVGESRELLGTNNDMTSYQAKMMLNFYGDPTLTLYSSSADIR
jgi:Peptidase family C25